MIEANHNDSVGAPLDASTDFRKMIAALRTAGADRFDPVGLHYIEALARHGETHQGTTRHLLDGKLAQALTAFTERFEHAQCNARETMVRAETQYPHAAGDMQQLFVTGDFKGLQRLIAALETPGQHGTLAALVRQLEQQAVPENSTARLEANFGSRPELKTIRNFRNTWSKLSADKQATRALQQAPENAGPINSHMLVLRSLALMRDISPDYLNRFMSYADTLLCLDQCEKGKLENAKKPSAARDKKMSDHRQKIKSRQLS